ncbi:MAG TPA: lysophospholipid acyltransferase family protein [Bryobacteraceae bacterium]|nr:lysophospholipid acyltransferase family protein [Bryobacteraceae bacterium]
MALFWSLVVVDPLIILSTFLCGCASVVVALFDSRGNATLSVARAWARSLLRFAGVRVTVEGLEKIDPGGRYVFCANHLSYMDPPVVLTQIPVQFRFLAKRGLFQIPFLGTHLTQAGHIPVNLDEPRAAVKTMTRAAEILRARAISLLIFPEGGRSEDGVLQPFKEGAAYIAIKAQVPLVPIALIGTRKIMAYGSATIRSGRVRLRIGNPIPTEGLLLKDRDRLTNALRERIVEMLACEMQER